MDSAWQTRRAKNREKWREHGMRRTVVLLAGLVLVAGVAIALVFARFSTVLDEEFYGMSSEGMDNYTSAQKAEVDASVQEIETALDSMAALAKSSGMDPEGAAFDALLDEWNARGTFQIRYASVAELEASLSASTTPDQDRLTLEMLRAGQGVVSEVRKSARLNGYYYSIAEPVTQNGSVVGVLRSVAKADSLLQTSQVSTQVMLVGSALVKDDGTIVATDDTTEPYDGMSLYDVLVSKGVSANAADEILSNIKEGQGVATVGMGSRDGRAFFATSARLSENGWHIVNFAQENTLAYHSQAILCYTVLAGGTLILVSVALCVIVAIGLGHARRRAARDAERYTVLSEFSDTMLFEYNYDDDRMDLSPNALDLFGDVSLSSDAYLRNGVSILGVGEDDFISVREALMDPTPSVEGRQVMFRARVESGERRWFSCQLRYLYEDAKPYAAVGKIVDITKQRRTEDTLREQSQTDGLTKLLNKVTVQQRATELLEGGVEGTLFVLDVDAFKQVNDVHGHAAGDQVLQGVASALRSAFREDDLVGRIGGDEFAAFVACPHPEAVVQGRLDLLEKAAAKASQELGIPFTVSIGTACAPKEGATWATLFEAADRAMYAHKAARER